MNPAAGAPPLRCCHGTVRWLSTKREALKEEKATWYYTAIKSIADFTQLQSQPGADQRSQGIRLFRYEAS